MLINNAWILFELHQGLGRVSKFAELQQYYVSNKLTDTTPHNKRIWSTRLGGPTSAKIQQWRWSWQHFVYFKSKLMSTSKQCMPNKEWGIYTTPLDDLTTLTSDLSNQSHRPTVYDSDVRLSNPRTPGTHRSRGCLRRTSPRGQLIWGWPWPCLGGGLPPLTAPQPVKMDISPHHDQKSMSMDNNHPSFVKVESRT